MEDKISSHWPISVTSGLASLFNLFLPLALVRILSPEQMGHYKLFFMYIMMSPAFFLVSGLSNGLYLWSGRSSGANAELRQTWSLFIVVCTALCLLGLGLSGFAPSRFSLSHFDIRIFLISAPLSLMSVYLEDLLVAQNRIWPGSLYGSITNAARALAILGTAWVYREVEPILWAFLFINLARVLVGFLLVVFTCGVSFLRPSWNAEVFRRVFSYAFPISIAGLAAVGVTNVDQLILSVSLDPMNFAFYTLGCLTVPPLQTFESSVNRVAIPRMAQEFGRGKTEKAAEVFRASVAELFRYLFPATIGLIIFARPIIELLFTTRYIEASSYLRVYALVYLLLAFPYDVVARARGEGSWILRTMLQFMGLSLLVTWAAAHHFGAMGALLALVGMQTLIRLYSFWHLKRNVFSGFSFFPIREIITTILFTGALSLISISLEPIFPTPHLWFLVVAPAFGLIYLGGILLASNLQKRVFTKPIAVIELCQFHDGGGLERMAWNLTRHLSGSEEFRPQFVSYDQWRDDQPVEQNAPFPVRHWNKGQGFSFSTLGRLLQLIIFEKVAIVHAHDLGPLVYGTLCKVLLPGRVRLLLTQHSLLQMESRKNRIFYRLLLPFVDVIAAVSPAVLKGMVQAGARRSRIELIENGARFVSSLASEQEQLKLRTKLAPGLSQEAQTIWILALSRIHPGKGHREVLNAWAELAPDIRKRSMLLFVGPETDPELAVSLKRFAATLPDSERIQFMGESKEPTEWLAASDVFISGSLHEGRPLAPLEAAGSGLLTFLSEIEGHRFLEGHAQFLNFNQPKIAAEKISLALRDLGPETRLPRFKKTQEIRSCFGESTMCEHYSNLLQRIARLHAGGKQ